MAVTTIISNKESRFSKILVYLVGITGIGLVVFFGGQLIEYIGDKSGKAGISVEATNSQASVFIDGQKVGETPYTSSDLKPGIKTVALKTETRQYQTSLKFIPSNETTIHMVGVVRDLGISDTFSSGQEYWFEKDTSGNTVRIISEPSEASVYVDKSEIGKTPFSSATITPGNYTITISYPNYESQVSPIVVQKGYTLNGNVKLFPYPLPSNPKLLQDSQNLYDLSLDNAAATADTESWAKAVIYWNTTRGVNLGDSTGIKEKAFDFFLDYKGNIFNRDGNAVKSADDVSAMGELKKGGYLGRISDGLGLTKEAKESLSTLSGKISGGKTATIGKTPYGWLRVRNSAGLAGTEVGKVNTGEKYSILEEKIGWIKIKVSETVTGWVSSDYVTLSE
jgi:hypothetical protein